jgi:hypothetical protein
MFKMLKLVVIEAVVFYGLFVIYQIIGRWLESGTLSFGPNKDYFPFFVLLAIYVTYKQISKTPQK